MLTVIVVFQVAGSPPDPLTVTGAPGGPGATFSTAAPTAPMNGSEAAIASAIGAGALPAGPDFASTGPGTWHTVAGTTPARGTGGRAYTYTVEVEDGLQSADADQAFAAAVDATLADPRSWIGGGQVTLQRVDSADPSFRISLTSQMTVRSPAPVMMQQSWSTANDDLTVLNPQLIPADGKVCLPNPYPFPDAAPASAASASAPDG